MNAIRIPEKPITLMQAAQLLAEAASPGNPDAVQWSRNELLALALNGTVRGRNPLTLAPVDISGILPDDYASLMVLTGDDLRQLASERSLRIDDGGVDLPHSSAQEVERPPQSKDTCKGTPPALTDEQKIEIVRLYDRSHGSSIASLSRQFCVSRPTIDKVLKRFKARI